MAGEEDERRRKVRELRIGFLTGTLRYDPAEIAEAMLRRADEHNARRGLSPEASAEFHRRAAANRWGLELCGQKF